MRASIAIALLLSAPLGSVALAEPSPRDVLPADPRPIAYHLRLTPDPARLTFAGRVVVTLDSTTAPSRILLDAIDLTIDGAQLDGAPITAVVPRPKEGRVELTLPRPLAPGRHQLALDYRGKINEAASGLFISRFPSAEGERHFLLTQLEPGDARKLLPLWDEPGLKATFTLELVVGRDETAVSNMPIRSVDRAADGATQTVRFEPTPPTASYLLFVGVGPFHALSGPGRSPRLSVLTKAGSTHQGRYALDETRRLLAYYADYFGRPYSLPKLDLIAAPLPGSFGAMENWGAILFEEQLLLVEPGLSSLADRQDLYDTVAHEVAHQWFGNLVTMGWWDDLWLKEGFASWMATKAAERFNPSWQPWLAGMASTDRVMSQDARVSTHPVVQPVRAMAQAEQAFDAITYVKGMAVIRMIEAYLGERSFRDGLRLYMRRHAHGNAASRELWAAIESAARDASGVPIGAIAADFTEQPGVPLVRVEAVRCAGKRSIVTLVQERYAEDAASRAPLRWRVPVVLGVVGQPPARVLLDGRAEVTAPGCGAVKVNLGQTGYYRVAYAAEPAAALRASFPRLSVADQLGVLYDAHALGLAGYGPVEDHLALAATLAPSADPLVWTQVAQAVSAWIRLHRGLPDAPAFAAYARALLTPVRVHLESRARRAQHSATRELLHASLLDALGALDDPAVIAEAHRRFEASARAPDALPGALREVLLGVVGTHADLARWEALRVRARTSSSATEQLQYLHAMARARDPALADRTLALALGAEVPARSAADLVDAVGVVHPEKAWRYYLAHRAQLDERLDALERYSFGVRLLAGSADPRLVREIEAFATAHIPADARAPVGAALARIARDVQLRAERVPALDAWIASRATPR